MKRLLALLAVLVFVAFPALAQSGALKVTSFPSGAQVSVDGTNTGKPIRTAHLYLELSLQAGRQYSRLL